MDKPVISFLKFHFQGDFESTLLMSLGFCFNLKNWSSSKSDDVRQRGVWKKLQYRLMRLRIVAVRLPTVSLSPGHVFIRPAESACRTCWLCSLVVTSFPWKRWNRLTDKRASHPGLSDIHKRTSALSSGGAMRILVAELALTLWLFVEVSIVCRVRHYLSFDRRGECCVLYLILYGQ